MMHPALLSFVLVTAILSACSSPRASFYRLSVDASLTLTTARATSRPIIVGPVTVSDLVDRPQIVTRSTNNEVALNEYARWAEPLKSSIADAITADLTLLLGSEKVAVASRSVADSDALRVRIDIQQFESFPGEAVEIDARWSVRRFGDDATSSGRSLVREPVTGSDWDALVAAHSRALASVSRAIVAAIDLHPSH